MLLPSDEITLQKRGISKQQIEEQLRSFVTGFPFLEIKSAASIGNGLLRLSDDDMKKYLAEWEQFLKTDAGVLKFVPASGAASRMFKDLFSFLDHENEKPEGSFEKKFFKVILSFNTLTDS